MPEEQRRILEMLASQQISVEQADRLLEAVTPLPPHDGAPNQERMRAQRHSHPHGAPHSPLRTTTDGGTYLREMRTLGLSDLKPNELIALKSTGVNGAYVRDLHAHGLSTVDANDLIALKSMGVDGAYIQELRDAGLEDLDAHDLIAFKSQDIDGAYVRRMRAAGFADVDSNDLIALKSQGIDAWDEADDELSDEPGDQGSPGATQTGNETARLLSADTDLGNEPDTDQS